jgi:hypothetical protein
MDVLRKCDYNSSSNRLCREVGFQIEDKEMLKFNARILTQPQIQTGLNSKANVRIGRIPLDGHLFTPKPISALAITYFGENYEQNKSSMLEFRKILVNVSPCSLKYRNHLIILGNEKLSCRSEISGSFCLTN